MHGGEFDTESSRIKIIIISNFEKRLQLPRFSPVRDILLNSHCYANVFEPKLTKNQIRLLCGQNNFQSK